VAVLLAFAGCAEKKPTSPTAGPVGTPDGSRVRLMAWGDSGQVGAGTGARMVRLGLLEQTPASEFTLWRQEPSGGYRMVSDYGLSSEATFISQGAQYYEFFDLPPSTGQSHHYLAQGAIGGVYGAGSPLSNVAAIDPALPPPTDSLIAVCPVDSACADSMPRLVWRQVAGAAGYLLQIYRSRRDARPNDLFDETRAQPFYPKATHQLLAYIPADPAIPPGGNVRYQVGSAGTATILESRLPMLSQQLYRWRVVALTAEGHLKAAVQGFPITAFFTTPPTLIPDSRFNVYNAQRDTTPIQCKCP
jgi:hypothetical protein